MKTAYLVQQDVDNGGTRPEWKHTNDIGIALTEEIAKGIKKKYDLIIPEINEVSGCHHHPCEIFEIKLFEEQDI